MFSSRFAQTNPPPSDTGRDSPDLQAKPRQGDVVVLMNLREVGVVDDRNGRVICRQYACVGSSGCPRGRSSVDSEKVTSSSRIASSGGLVHLANSSVK